MKYITLETAKGMKVRIPMYIVATHRANRFKQGYNNNLTLSVTQGTEPLFESNPDEAVRWAREQMSWDEVKQYAAILISPELENLEQDWGGHYFSIEERSAD